MLDGLRSWPEWFQTNLGGWVDWLVSWLQRNAQWLFDFLNTSLRGMLRPIEDTLLWLPWPVTIAAVTLLALGLGNWRLALAVAVGLLFIGSMGLWNLAMITLGLIIAATVISVVIGVPIGILMARNELVNRLVRPVLDFMQTMPSFVYLIPAVLLLSIGRVPALLAVIIYAVPPVIRLTNLGIRNVPKETVEAGLAFGATSGQLLRKVQLPLGFPTIMAGINQTIMMALAMVIVASLIGAGGLGDEVLVGLSRLQVGRAFEAGFAIVILAIVIDRISEKTSTVGERRRQKQAKKRSGRERAQPAAGGDGKAMLARRDAPADTSTPVLVAEHVYKIFGPLPQMARRMAEEGASRGDILAKTRSTVAVHDVSLEVYPGETFIVMGLSGSGKSTLVRCVNRLIEPTSGTVQIEGDDVGAMDDNALNELRRKKLGMVFQRFALLPHRTVLDNVTFGLELQGADRDARDETGRRVLAVVGLDGWEHSYPEELSGGMQQRVGLARALANDPHILLMDEPFSALDPLMRRQLQEELRDLQSRMQRTIIFITHDLDEALKLGDRIAIMKDGRFVQVGTPEDILLRPADDYVASFIEGHDKSEMLCARDVMWRPSDLIKRSQEPHVALRIMERTGRSKAFVVDRENRLAGLVTAADVADAARRRLSSLDDILIQEVPTAGPDERLRELIPVAAHEAHPIAVVDDDLHLLGIVARASILQGLVAGEEAAELAGEAPEDRPRPADVQA